jgi:streptogramin lyase/mono/diheme cytochrome c family protein
MTNLRSLLVAGTASLIVVTAVQAADRPLSGTITSASGQKLEGVTVSAKQEGSTITTSVYTDGTGTYYFPLLPSGRYQVWAQALGFERARGSVDLSAGRRHDLALRPITDPERRIRQLPSELLVAALPEGTDDDARMKRVFMNNCTGCHAPGYVLQFRFDQAGWSKVIDLMKVVPVTGVYPGPNTKANKILDHNQQELAAYLSRARGPGKTSMKFVNRPRPTGEAARAVWTLYDLPLNPDAGIGTRYNENDGTDWALGTTSKLGQMPHDGGMGLDGTLYFTVNNPNTLATIGRVDPKTGHVSYLKVPAEGGRAANAHGLTRDAQGNFWFDVNPGRRSLGKLDTATQKIAVYETPKDMVPLGGAVTMDVDGKGKIWASAADGAVRFDPVTEKFVAFKSLTPYRNPKGTAMTYGAAGDRDGNGWWAMMSMDTIGHGDVATGKVTEVKLPPVKDEMGRLKPEERAFYEGVDDLTFNAALPWAQGPRRMGTDKNADVLWVGNSWGASLTRINTKTSEATIVPLPNPTMQTYHVAVDRNHSVWGDLWSSDQIYRMDPATQKVTTFDLPVRGTEIRHISLLERDGKLNVVMPVYRSSQMGVMTVRSEADLAATKAQAK